MDVALIQWPAEERRRSRLAERGQPRLLLVSNQAEPPTSVDLLEDWVRLPAPDEDVRARVRGLELRINAHRPEEPTVDGQGILRYRSESTQLTELQVRLAGRLIEGFGVVVGRDHLISTGWGGTAPSRNTFDVHMGRLRKRLNHVGLTMRTVRARGFVLDADSPCG